MTSPINKISSPGAPGPQDSQGHSAPTGSFPLSVWRSELQALPTWTKGGKLVRLLTPFWTEDKDKAHSILQGLMEATKVYVHHALQDLTI